MAEIFAFHECWVSQQDAVATGSTGRMWHEHTVDIRSTLNNTVIAVCGWILTFGSELHIHGFIQSTITMPVPEAKLLIRPYTVFYLMMFVKPYTSECHVQACKMPMACVICDPLYDESCCYLTVSPSQVTVPDWLWKHGSTMSLGNRWKCRLSGEWMRWSSSCSPVIQGKAWVKQTLFTAGNMSSNELMFFLANFCIFFFAILIHQCSQFPSTMLMMLVVLNFQ